MDPVMIDKMELTELANKLFMYTDDRQWQLLQEEVFMPEILFDMQSLSGQAAELKQAREVCAMWEIGFAGIDSVHHQAGHYLITVNNNDADIYAYAIALHYKKEAVSGNTRSFTGSYDLKARRTDRGWRLAQFKYNFKFIDGNAELK